MRVRCKCGKVAVIQSSSIESDIVKKLYCSCSNPECGHTFVVDLVFSHTLSPSALDMPKELLDKIQTMTGHQQKKLFADIAHAI